MRTMVAAYLLAGSALAFAGVRVQPMTYDLKPSGDGARQDLRVENTSATPSPIEIRVERREVLPDGTDKRTPAEDDFLVFPPQGIVPANGFQTFRIQYVGDPAITASRLYTITVAQLPVAADGTAGATGVQIVYNIGTLAAVSPDKASANIAITKVAPGSELNRLEVSVENKGARYARLRDGVWTIKAASGTTETIDRETTRTMMQNSLIEAGKTRVIQLPVSAGFQRDGATVTFVPNDNR